MKKTILAAAIALTGMTALSTAQAQLTYTSGDALLFFRATGGTGSDKNIQIDLGDLSAGFNAPFSINLSASNSIVSATYGNNWWTRNDLYWGVIGSSDTTVSTVVGLNGGNTGVLTGSTVLTVDALASISGSVGNMYTAGIQGGASQGTVAGHYYSIYGAGYSGSATQEDTAPVFFNQFSGSIGTVAASFQTNQIWAYTVQQSDPFAPNANVQTATASITGGTIAVNAVPEPSTYALMGLGALLLIVAYRRKANA
jgi:hypothetical protein